MGMLWGTLNLMGQCSMDRGKVLKHSIFGSVVNLIIMLQALIIYSPDSIFCWSLRAPNLALQSESRKLTQSARHPNVLFQHKRIYKAAIRHTS